jgi:hypothetical protein
MMDKSSKHTQSKTISKKNSMIIGSVLLASILFIAWNIYHYNLNNRILLTENIIHGSGLNVKELPRAPYKWPEELPWKSTGYNEKIEVDSIEYLIDYASEVGVETIHRNGSDFYVFCTNRAPRIYHLQFTP